MKKRKSGKERAMYAFGTMGVEDMIGGEGDEKTKKKPLTATDYSNWNNVVKYARSKKLDPDVLDHDSKVGYGIIDEYNKANPTTAFDRTRVQDIQSLMLDYRERSINRMKSYSPELQKSTGFYPTKDFGEDFSKFMPNLSKPDNFPGSKTLNWEIPGQYITSTTPEGTTKKAVGFAPQKLALGTGADGVGGYGGLIQQIPGVANGIIDMLEHNPNAYSDQPIMNASTIKGMKTPYSFALGGEVGDEEQMQQLQDMADEQGISVEDLIAQLQSQQDPDDMDMGEDPMPESEPDYTEEEPDDVGETFGGQFAYGGRASHVPIEVEGKEALQTPNGNVHKAVGPSHANGGVDVNVPPGTKIYSDRIKVDGKSMAERKIKRERAQKRIEKLKLKHPYDPLANNSLQRTMQVNQAEEAEDMQLQEALKGIEDRKKFAYGSDGVGIPPRRRILHPWDEFDGGNTGDYVDNANPDIITSDSLRSSASGIMPANAGQNYPVSQPTPDVETPDGSPFTTGDYVGMAGNLFNAVAPFINSRNAANATKPTLNRYRGFGQEAIAANDTAQTLANTMQSEALTDISTSENSAIERGRNSASSVNTARAMDIAATIGADKARIGARDANIRQLIGLAGQRGQLTNLRDRMVDSGQERADIENDAKTDNKYSNTAANLVNFGTNIEGLGRNLNTAKSNQTDANLTASMAKNNIKVDTGTGKIVNKYMDKETVQRYLDMGYTLDENGKLVRPRKSA